MDLGQVLHSQLHMGFPDNSSQNNSSRTTCRGQFVAKYNINFIKSTASISATFFSSIPLPLQQHHFHHSRFSISPTLFSSPPLPLLQYLFHHSRFHFRNILLINPASISATLLSSFPLPLQQYSYHQSRLHFILILFINSASTSATLSCLQIYLLQDVIV